MDCPEAVPSLEGGDPWLCCGGLQGPFTPALFLRGGWELGSGWSFQPPTRSGISGPNHFQMAVGPLQAPPAPVGPACQSSAAFILGESVLKESFDLEPNYISWALPLHPPPGEEGPRSVL